ncbi:hypothetical protein KIH27_11355 [Mycobacterium sp. M1]|uniref:Uncharacterized protein n=1 Tax=Mycolicibacter acidiphilus TaxID=2835306 RepID=A0ABS5RIQ1_9MYCO|nr:hypothetical protein [Mycolicibacter acidiphilus]MBS9534183.1 hypothetical protein [Mycolicibacter acidiphilus]
MTGPYMAGYHNYPQQPGRWPAASQPKIKPAWPFILTATLPVPIAAIWANLDHFDPLHPHVRYRGNEVLLIVSILVIAGSVGMITREVLGARSWSQQTFVPPTPYTLIATLAPFVGLVCFAALDSTFDDSWYYDDNGLVALLYLLRRWCAVPVLTVVVMVSAIICVYVRKNHNRAVAPWAQAGYLAFGPPINPGIGYPGFSQPLNPAGYPPSRLPAPTQQVPPGYQGPRR